MTISGGTPSLASFVDAESVLDGEGFDLEHIPLCDPNAFLAGQLGRERVSWENIISGCDMDADILSCVREWLFEGVNVEKFFVHFKGN